MALYKHEIPILEYDDDPRAVLEPTHEGLSIHLPEKAVFAFLGEAIDDYARAHNARVAEFFISATKEFPVYIVNHQGEDICLMQAPVGASAAAQILDFLIGYGVRKIISAGSCGVLTPREENAFLIPVKAMRDEGASYHYLPPARYVETSEHINNAIRSVMSSNGLPCEDCVTWTTDGFYRETRALVEYRKQEGCDVVEMECAALAACARFRGAEFGQILYTADSLAGIETYDERNWGRSSVDKALTLCFLTAEQM